MSTLKTIIKRASVGALALLPLLTGCKGPETGSTEQHVSQPNKPNVLFILVDDLGVKDLGIYGSESYKTPSLDALANRSVRYTNAYAASPICSPSRAALVTGKSPTRVNITDWISGWGDKGKPLQTPAIAEGLALEEETLAEVMKSKGYRTFFAGKWHLGGEEYLPELQGFDINKGGHHKGSPPGGYYSPYKNPHLEDGPDGEYLPDRLTNETISFIEQAAGEPFFAMLSFYTVHTPIQASKRHIDQYQHIGNSASRPRVIVDEGSFSMTSEQQDNPKYASMVTAMDENVGRLLDALEATGELDNTLVIFTSDNGGLSTVPKKRNRYSTSNFPYRAGKAFVYDGGIRVPLIIKYPEQQQGSVSHYPTIGMDIFATAAQTVGHTLSTEQAFDGVDLRQEPGGAERPLYWHYPHYHIVGWAPGGAMRQGDWKLMEDFETGAFELYNLANDPSEKNNLAAAEPQRVQTMAKQLAVWRDEVGAKMPSKR